VPRLRKIWADAAYRGKELADWYMQHGGWELEIMERETGIRGFQVRPRRRVVERTFSWLGRQRRLSKDYERLLGTAEAFIYLVRYPPPPCSLDASLEEKPS
jgi:transposase